ncbi:DNA-directed RNA polymerases ii 24 kda polypeptide [Dioszegia hungarica]|uniref:DNA-directed RNA polymerases I, II, and III subunit RPABC1 n=1 Tax=Dioszegia hungarica TaxID=4972 RepID=A0AA38LRY7_9TREE|nr:DNA-directed RNA polymerases ii 24 kda polypeptide [Dioszegia hungarica]KAI9633600.1 DNA-directed RNA polymerases ii 24 kda polypeptide [Dioszegia hungarica]
MSEIDRELARLWRVSRTVHEMCKDRGYAVAEYEINETLDDFRDRYGGSGVPDSRGGMSFPCDHENAQGDRIYVYFCPEKNVSKAAMKTMYGALEKHSAKKGIIIYAEKLSSVARKTMQEMASEYHVEEFPEAELLVNITKHFLVPKHQIMAPSEKAELIKKYRLKETQLPRIMVTDPVAKYYGMRRGQVMKIERASETAGRYITYRICM